MVYLRRRGVDGGEVGQSGIQVGGCSGRRCTNLKALYLIVSLIVVSMEPRLAGPDRGTGTGPDRTDFSAVWSQSKRPDRETVSIFGLDRTETFIAQAFINKLG